MNELMRERIVVSVGGSLIVPDEIATDFLSSFRDVVVKKIGEGFSFYIITGGGKVTRRYQSAAKQVNLNVSTHDLDSIGIASTRLNAELVRSLFVEVSIPAVIQDNSNTVPDVPILISGGIGVGHSSDAVAVNAARAIGARRLVNLSNIDYVYTADPRTNPGAEKIENISWADFRKLIPSEWDPGLSSPFDPVAAREAEAAGIEVAVINGAKLDEFEKYLEGGQFVGTKISN